MDSVAQGQAARASTPPRNQVRNSATQTRGRPSPGIRLKSTATRTTGRSSANKGTATRLATGEINDTRPKSRSSAGSSPTATAHWGAPHWIQAREPALDQTCARGCCPSAAAPPPDQARGREPRARIRTITAPKESQNPKDRTAWGSMASTRAKARVRAARGRGVRPQNRAVSRTASITRARWVETANPARAL